MPRANDMMPFTDEYMVSKPSEQQVQTIGLSAHPVTGDVVSKFRDGYCLSIVRWTKRVDRTAVNEAIKEKIAQFSSPIKKSEKEQIKNDIILEMLPHILPSPKYIFAYYHEESKTLIIDSANSKDADQATSLLRKAIGSLKATTLYIDTRIGLTSSLKNHLENGSEFINESILLGNVLELSSLEGKVKFTDLDLTDQSTSEEIVTQISNGGMHIKSVQLNCGVAQFDLSSEFKLKKIKFDFEPDSDEDKYSTWLSETLLATNYIVNITHQLVERFKVVE